MSRLTHADPGPLGFYSDAARRLSDAYNLHLIADPAGNLDRWIAFKLENGECDQTLYDTKADAIRAQGLFAKLYGYVIILAGGMSPQAAASFIQTARQVASNPNLRWRQTDADAPSEHVETLLMPLRKEMRR